ncbi:MAG: hypothetical protein ACXWQO_17970 [Bdellovibrionota bacterium]
MLGKSPFGSEVILKLFSAQILLLTGLLALVSGCAKKQEDVPAAQEKQQVLSGSLTENLTSVLNDEARGNCDDSSREAKLELVRALDAKNAEIESFTKNNIGVSASSRYRRVSLGPITVRERALPSSPKLGWQVDSTSWKTALSDFAFFKDKPMSAGWTYLNSDVRSLLLEDVNRVVNFQNPFLGKDDGAPLELLESSIQNCVATSDCQEVEIPRALEHFMSIQPNYRVYMGSIQNKTSFNEKRRMILKFQRYVKIDANIYKFQVNSKMRRIGNGKYELMADPGPFGEVIQPLRGYIESEWRSPVSQVSLKWRDSSLDSDLFRIVLGAVSGERSYVSRSDKVIMLYPDVRSKSIAHEFGHVMGFPDRYYTVWHPELCEYQIQGREDDIMSDPENGSVIQEHWDELSRHY